MNLSMFEIHTMKPSMYEIPIPAVGRMFVMPKPSGEWLAEDIKAYKSEGIDFIVSMLTGDEAHELGLEDEQTLCEASGIQFVQYPIVDRGVPNMIDLSKLVVRLSNVVQSGSTIAIHCRAGIGRSGLVAACVLISLGSPADDVIDKVSESRGVLIPDTFEQASFIRAFGKCQNKPQLGSQTTS